MKTIELTRGKQAIVDDEAYEYLTTFKWHYADSRNNGRGYARRNATLDESREFMHHFVYGAKILLDHKNGNSLDNRLENLRPVTVAQNCQNRSPNDGRKFKGTNYVKFLGRWRSYIKYAGRQKHLGLFDSEEDAARAYDVEALKVWGEFARLNFEKEQDV